MSELLRVTLIFVFGACVLGGGLAHYFAFRLERKRASVAKPTQASVRPANGARLVIRRALYGTGPQTDISVTDKLNDAVRDALVVPVDNSLVPRDPALNVQKRLYVEYSYGNDSVLSVVRPESTPRYISRLVLPEDSEIARLTSEIEQLRSARSRQLGKAGALMSRAGEAEALARELEKIWHLFNNEGVEKLIRPLSIKEIPDEVKAHRHKQLIAFRAVYQWHIASVREIAPEFQSETVNKGFPTTEEYLEVKRNLEEHAKLLRELAAQLSTHNVG